ncbi:TIGR02452 family protein [Paenibacillus sp. WQ 127069]|uniref:TIGR02452 family protein n=1 Tax=Paenibacillus baimaensis TaxID=2982185 RepID=A0ABT2UCL5_9BACL|nr:TIGR02452 family protein [Paenibacillus sp. WQ 127069]MCU6792375.1 TIGR02452 family protein [Paenibacillus sp. WQ 127069]
MNKSTNNREVRSQMAKETLDILEKGFYINLQGSRVPLKKEIEKAICDTILYVPDMLPVIKKDMIARIAHGRETLTSIEVTAETTLEAARRIVLDHRYGDTLCLNFASAKNPGGGFLGGSQAQEESLARSSALYPCIEPMNEMYTYNRNLKTCLYSDYMIHSPKVPVFREDIGKLLAEPFLVSILTAPAVNAGVVREREPHNVVKINPVMSERIRYILSVAALHGDKSIILGAYGCGVFKNDPNDVAQLFKQVLIEEGYHTLFDKIVFAIIDKSDAKRTLNIFKKHLIG